MNYNLTNGWYLITDIIITMLSEADFGFDRDEAVYVREYLANDVEGDREWKHGLDEAGWFFGKIVGYSLARLPSSRQNQGIPSKWPLTKSLCRASALKHLTN